MPAYATVTDSFGYLLRRAHRGSAQLAESTFVGEELSFPQWVSLVLLRDGIADTAGGLARCLGHDAGAMTRLLDQIEDRGLMCRERSKADRRVVHLALTAEGRVAIARLMPKIDGLWEDLLEDFSVEEIAVFKSLLRRLVDRLDVAGGGL